MTYQNIPTARELFKSHLNLDERMLYCINGLILHKEVIKGLAEFLAEQWHVAVLGITNHRLLFSFRTGNESHLREPFSFWFDQLQDLSLQSENQLVIKIRSAIFRFKFTSEQMWSRVKTISDVVEQSKPPIDHSILVIERERQQAIDLIRLQRLYSACWINRDIVNNPASTDKDRHGYYHLLSVISSRNISIIMWLIGTSILLLSCVPISTRIVFDPNWLRFTIDFIFAIFVFSTILVLLASLILVWRPTLRHTIRFAVQVGLGALFVFAIVAIRSISESRFDLFLPVLLMYCGIFLPITGTQTYLKTVGGIVLFIIACILAPSLC